MHVAHLSLRDFRSHAELELDLEPGVTCFVGRNGQGKTNIVEAVDYLSRLSSHRVAADAPLVRQGAEQAVVRAAVIREGRRAVLEVAIRPGQSNRARVNGTALPRARELLGLVKTVVFAPDDLALVKGDPGERRRYLDDLLIQQTPRYAGIRADYDRVLKQRNSLLKTARAGRYRGAGADVNAGIVATLEVWDANLARLGGEIWSRRMLVADALAPLVGTAYQAVARGASREDAGITHRPCVPVPEGERDPAALAEVLLEALTERRSDELDRGISLVGPHRDELVCSLGELPVKGYASHGESWSFAVALRLAGYELLRDPQGADDPILVLDDVFAELDATRRDQLAELVAGAEQVLVTAAVLDDVPPSLRGRRFVVADGRVRPDTDDATCSDPQEDSTREREHRDV